MSSAPPLVSFESDDGDDELCEDELPGILNFN